MKKISLPEQFAGLPIIASVSGGKDSTAMALALKESGVQFRMVFADTGWEADETYAHLEHLRERIGPIDVCGAEGGMVARIKHRAGFPARMQRWCGHDRVGCFPCVYSNKEDIRLVAEHAPERIDLIRQLEAECVTQRRERNVAKPGRYAYPDDASFFQSRESDGRLTNIDRVVEWSKTSHGGKQLPLLQPAPDGGCFRWGLCEPPAVPAVCPTVPNRPEHPDHEDP